MFISISHFFPGERDCLLSFLFILDLHQFIIRTIPMRRRNEKTKMSFCCHGCDKNICITITLTTIWSIKVAMCVDVLLLLLLLWTMWYILVIGWSYQWYEWLFKRLLLNWCRSIHGRFVSLRPKQNHDSSKVAIDYAKWSIPKIHFY